MNKMLLAFGMLFSLLAHSSHKDYRMVFSSDIYDQESLNELSSDEEKLELLHAKQMEALKTKVFKNLDKIIGENQDKVIELGKAKISLLWALPVAVVFESIPIPLALGLLLGDHYNTKIQAETEKLGKDSEVLEWKKRIITGGLKARSHSDLERAYVLKKNNLNKERQKKIETHLILAYDSKINDAQMNFLDALIFLPDATRCLSMSGDPATFRKGLADAKIRLAEALKRLNVHEDHAFICQQVLVGIAKASINNFQTKTQTQEAYYLRTLKDLRHYAQQVAIVLDRSSFVVDANTQPLLNDEYCFGVKQQKRGLFLEPFLAGDKGQRIKNPILIILNADRWFNNDENFKFIFKLLDKSSTSFDSAYLGMNVDWSALCIICFGATNSKEFHKALQSRLHCHDLTRELR